MTSRHPRTLGRLRVALLVCAFGCSASGNDTTSGGTDATAATGDETTAGTDAPATTGDAPTTSGGPSSVTDAATSNATPGDDTTTGVDTGDTTTTGAIPSEPFSFFVTSLKAMQELSGSQQGFGGDLRFGEEGPGAGLRGADKICAAIAEKSMPGAGNKPWRAFLSATAGEDGEQVDAIDRVGEGPWYDRLGRLFAATKADLVSERPIGIDAAIKDDFPNEDGVPNHQPDPLQDEVDNHDFLTGTNENGQLYSSTATCLDWTSAIGDRDLEGRPRVGHSWPRYGGMGGPGPGPGPGPDGDGSMAHWMSSLDESGCAPGVNLIEMGPPQENAVTVGSGGGYGGIYCFSLIP
ncbi:hypothetical protein [Nannocystis radixulma]|uniref:Uncharacterized protein n=1 Tax=Nannocystis radixulma TaxID=2995305 RepID=A0ABT5BE30_9BACT|nr:hypothetical protein [Nannocystis radixulma]MDC0672386.1 hypothetical protein [Nannocystis radixulma]